MIMVETGGTRDCTLNGKSGEKGCLQYKPATWKAHSLLVLDRIVDQTPINERYVAIKRVQMYLNEGYSGRDIALIWNGGEPICKKGVNSYGVQYDSCAHADKVLAYLNQ